MGHFTGLHQRVQTDGGLLGGYSLGEGSKGGYIGRVFSDSVQNKSQGLVAGGQSAPDDVG